MAQVQSDGIPVRTVAYSAAAIIATIIGVALWDGITTDREHAERITVLENTQAVLNQINRRLELIEDAIRGQ